MEKSPLPILGPPFDESGFYNHRAEAASIQLGPGFGETELNKKHLILFQVISHDSLYNYFSTNNADSLKKKPVERVAATPDHLLGDWRYFEDPQGNRLKLFFGAFPSDNRFRLVCGLIPSWIASDGEVLDGRYITCMGCFLDADPMEMFPDITAKESSDNTLSISWSPILEADGYGVIIWPQQPTPDGFFKEIIYTVEFSADIVPIFIDTSLPTNQEYYIAVWAVNWDTSEDSWRCSVQPSYVMDLEYFGIERPTKVQQSSWGQLKNNFRE